MTATALSDADIRASQANDLLRIANETSNRSEAERASAARRADRAAAALARVRTLADAIDTEMRTEPDTQRAAMQMEAVTRIRAALEEPTA
jgi:hypothetical protein